MAAHAEALLGKTPKEDFEELFFRKDIQVWRRLRRARRVRVPPEAPRRAVACGSLEGAPQDAPRPGARAHAAPRGLSDGGPAWRAGQKERCAAARPTKRRAAGSGG